MRIGGRTRTHRRTGAVLASITLLVLTACTGGPSGGPRSPAPGAGDEIVVASGRDVTGKNGIRQRLIDAWNDSRDGSTRRARLVELPGSADQQRSQMLGALQSGSSRYDVVNLDVTWIPEFAEAGLIRQLDDAAVVDPGDLIPSVAATADWRGKRYAVPFNSDVGLLYYRRDFLADAHVQNTDLSKGITWPQLRKLMNYLDRHPPQGYEAGWTSQLDSHEGRTVNAVEAFASVVKDFALTDSDGRYTGSVQDLATGVGELRQRTSPAYTLDHAYDSAEQDTLNDFQAGRTAFLRHWPSAYGPLYQRFSERRLGVAALPGKAVLGGQNLAVTESSPHARDAAALIRFLTDPGSERCLLDAGFAATRTSAYTDDDLSCTHGNAPAAASAASPSASASGETTDRMPRDAAGRPRYAQDVLLPALRRAVQRPRTPLYGPFTQILTATLQPLFDDGSQTDAELAGRLDKALRKALSR
ncbi:extracellular solute-binding protein [Streptomyces actuosus]|uniref:Extracellular solute-binding protein n=1 Tax=Streptomyces actuosus TaxID=1885 RepID=A0ABS2VJZ6_STRAS|nr:extracellular solute-binding protein [Streptomyces actuosus]MBN0043434.1 extracellular solute-binding protein [Streptomyces actuosus]